jgi:hypothetical protein
LDKLSKWALIRVILILVGLLYGTLHHFTKVPAGFNEGFTILLLLLVLELVVEILIESHAQHPWTMAKSSLSPRSLNGKVLAALEEELAGVLHPEKAGFRVAHKTLALSSYETFWRLLVKAQQQKQHPMHLKVIHSCDFEIWVDHPLTKPLIERHKLFIAQKGVVERILCGSGPEPDEKIHRAAETMKSVDITVFYFNMDNTAGIPHDFSWDFLYAEEIDLAVIWASFSRRPHGVIGEAVYLDSGEYKGQNLEQLWSEIKDRSIDFPFREEITSIPSGATQ